ncbi:MAG: hypothetical protein RL885_16240 [Planctomycetota bacterium]
MARYDYGFGPYVPVAERRRKARQRIEKMRKAGRVVSPIEIQGRKIAQTFWGEAWCRNLESYSDYANRLPRGRTYVRNGSVLDLQIEAGQVTALVNGSTFYDVTIRIAELEQDRWGSLKTGCAGKIQSLVELLQGRLSKGVMEIVTRPGEGLFPMPAEIRLGCSCPDWAVMCKHVAAALYGIGARLDDDPELLFVLRGVDPAEMIESVVEHQAMTPGTPREDTLAEDDLADIFGIDFGTGTEEVAAAKPAKKRAAKKKAAKKTAKKKSAKKKTAMKKAPAVATKKGPGKSAAKRKSTTNRATKKKSARKKTRASKRSK